MSKPIRDLNKIFRKSISAVLPEKLIQDVVKYNPNKHQLTVFNDNYNLSNRNLYLVAFGKAVQYMTKEIDNIIGPHIKQGIISIPSGSFINNSENKNITYYEGAHNNLPDENAMKTAETIVNLLSGLNSNDLVLVLISGGGSALLPLPKYPIKLEEKFDLIKKLAIKGADIEELNTVRKRISAIKGGNLAVLAQPAQVISLVLSDVIGDPLDIIASGPTVQNDDTVFLAEDVIKKYQLFHEVPDSIKSVLSKNEKVNTFPKNNVKNYLIGSNKLCLEMAKKEAELLNYYPIVITHTLNGKVTNVAQDYVELLKYFCDYINKKTDYNSLLTKLITLNIPMTNIIDNKSLESKNICLIFGGETTVEVKGTGKGGRNQQLALEFSKYIYELRNEFNNFEVYLLSGGTDGIDGPTDAAGAIGYLDLISDATNQSLNADNYIKNNDSYNFYKKFRNGDLHIFTGHTNTNVMDIHLIILKHNRSTLINKF